MYAADDGPVAASTTRWYERRKHALTDGRAAARALPVGRSSRAAPSARSPSCWPRRCDRLLAVDAVAPAAVAAAATGSRDQPHVTVEQGRMPDDWPAAPFDLVVLSRARLLPRRRRPGPRCSTARGRVAGAGRRPGRGALAAAGRRLPHAGDEVHRRLACDPRAGPGRPARGSRLPAGGVHRVPPAARSVAQREGAVLTRIAVVVPAHDEQDLLPACLVALGTPRRRCPASPSR